MKRRSLRSTATSRSMSGRPATWLRKPSSVYSGMALMPERPSRKDCRTWSWSSPMHEMMPMPVMTTRRVLVVSLMLGLPCLSGRLRIDEQSDVEFLGVVDQLAVDEDLAVGHAQHQPAVDHALDVETILDELRPGEHLAGELEAAQAQRPARTASAAPAEEETEQLPQGIEGEAARHHGSGLEVAAEEP